MTRPTHDEVVLHHNLGEEVLALGCRPRVVEATVGEKRRETICSCAIVHEEDFNVLALSEPLERMLWGVGGVLGRGELGCGLAP